MESHALVSSSLECGDGCAKSAETLPVSDRTVSFPANQCSSLTSCFSSSSESGSGSIAYSRSSPKTEWASEKASLYNAADLLCSLHLNEPENAQHCTNSVAEVNCLEDGEAAMSNSICNSVMPTTEYIPSPCCCSSKHTNNALTLDESNIDTDAHICVTTKDSESNKIENGAMLPHLASDGVDSATKRCRHATADSSGSAIDYTATGCDIVFSDGIEYRPYGCERHLYEIMELVSRDLSEPYSIYTYRYFIYNWPNLCFRVSLIMWSTRSNYCCCCFIYHDLPLCLHTVHRCGLLLQM